MKKVLYLGCLLLFLIPVSSRGQFGTMGVHLTTGIPTGGNLEGSNITLGGGVTFDYFFNDYFKLGLDFNYLGFAFDTSSTAVTILPLQVHAAFHYPVSEDFDLYAGTGGGMFIARYSDRVAQLETETLYGITPRFGFLYQFGENVFLDINGTYAMVLSETNQDDVSGIVSFNIGISYNITSELL